MEETNKYMVLDNDKIFSALVTMTFKSLGITPIRTSIRCPWVNGIAERWIGSFRRELLDYVIILNQNQRYKLLEEYIEYYNQDRTHYHLDKDPPVSRPVQKKNRIMIKCLRCHVSAVCITNTSGKKLLKPKQSSSF